MHDVDTRSPTPGWPLWKRLPFRFLLCYLALYCVGLLDEVISFDVFLAAHRVTFPVIFPDNLWRHIVPWVGMHLLHFSSVDASAGGSGDTLFDWLLVVCELVLAAVAATVWTAVDNDRRWQADLQRWVTFAVRTLLAAEMFLYGLDKVFPLQFRDMTLSRMMEPMSSKTPMGILWDFMAASVGYTIFAGLVEVAAGILLLIPQTAMLGALLCAAAMTNVFVLNLTYDVPVKRGSGHLLLLSLFLVAPAVPRLLNFFLLNRPTQPERSQPLSSKRWINKTAAWTPIAFCLLLVVFACKNGFQKLGESRQSVTNRSQYYGIWSFTQLDLADPAKPLLTAKLMKSMDVNAPTDRWRAMIFEGRKIAVIQLGNGVMDTVEINDQDGSLIVTDSGDDQWKCSLKLEQTAPGRMAVSGTVQGNAIHAELARQDEASFPMLKRRFHWVNEW